MKCFLNNDPAGTVYKFLYLLLPFLIIFCYEIYVVFKVYTQFKKEEQKELQELQKKLLSIHPDYYTSNNSSLFKEPDPLLLND